MHFTIKVQYHPCGAGDTRSPPAMRHHLQNPKLPLDLWMEPMLFGITNDHSNYMQRPKRGSTRKWENRSLKVDLSLTMGWLPLRLRNTIGGGIPGMEAMFFGITNDHSNYMQRPKRGSIRKRENPLLVEDVPLLNIWYFQFLAICC